jgi:hypothetical protein
MSNWLIVIKLIGLVLSWWFEKDKAVKKRRAEGLKQVIDGIETEDPSLITAGFDKVRK